MTLTFFALGLSVFDSYQVVAFSSFCFLPFFAMPCQAQLRIHSRSDVQKHSVNFFTVKFSPLYYKQQAFLFQFQTNLWEVNSPKLRDANQLQIILRGQKVVRKTMVRLF